MSLTGPYPVTVHPYDSPTRNSCAYEIGPAPASKAVVFIGGLSDGPHTVSYIRHLAEHLKSSARHLDYSIFEIRMRSSFIGFGTSSLAEDVADISALVKYLRSIGKERIVLFGHSTGCQDCMEYTDYTKHSNEFVDGFIMQGPISDRESIHHFFPDYQKSLDVAAKMVAAGREKDCMPNDSVVKELGAPISAYRFLSLASKGFVLLEVSCCDYTNLSQRRGDDDYFSSDLDHDTVTKYWTRFTSPVLALHSEKDEFMPPGIDQEALNKRYRETTPYVSALSGLIPGAGHGVEEPDAQEWMAQRIVQYLESLCSY
ncbi:hypothetical protein G7046_g5462 [Stylonectria norvegica]|nr:hypothetical protein G7046_g5462 [Stylonectria norvegica]